MAGRPAVDLTVDQQALQRLGRAIRAEADGKELKRELTREFREVMEPARDRAVSRLMGTGHAGLATEGEPLRTAVKARTKVQVRLSGRSPGVSVRVGKIRARGFDMAGRRLDDKRGFRRRVYGKTWVTQRTTPPEWFDGTMRDTKKDNVRAARRVMQAWAQRIARRVR